MDGPYLPNPTIDTVAHIIQVALTPAFLLSAIASLLGVFAGRLARVADKVDILSDRLDRATLAERPRLERRLAYLRKRSHVLDVAVVLGALGGASTCFAALLLFVGALRDSTVASVLFAAFGLGLVCGAGALVAFLIEMLMASRGIREKVAVRIDAAEALDTAEIEPERGPDPVADGGSAP